jgi:outer membrane protein assembly factor BamB
MSLLAKRPLGVPLWIWLLAAVVLGVGGYRVYRHYFVLRGGEYSDARLLRNLETAVLPALERPAQTASWPQWRGPNRDGLSTETGLLTDWPRGGPRVLWRTDAGPGYSGLVVADGQVCTMLQDGDDEAVVCWDATTGKELWRFRYPAHYENSFGSGPRSTPAIDGGRIYSVGGTGILNCLRLQDGQKLWSHDLLEEFGASNLQWGVSFSPLVEGELVFANPGGPRGGSLSAFDKHSGKLAWKALDDPAGYSSPIPATVAGQRQVVFFTAEHLVGVTPADGTVLWKFPWQTQYGCNIATPIVRGDYIFISTGYGRGCALLHISQVDGKWDVERVYENVRMKNHFSSSVAFEEHLYGFDDAMLTCMEFRTGKVAWKQRGFDKGSLLIADGHLFVLGEQGKVAIAPATPEGFHEKASFAFSADKCWTMPIVAGGLLYLRDEKQVACYDLRH